MLRLNLANNHIVLGLLRLYGEPGLNYATPVAQATSSYGTNAC